MDELVMSVIKSMNAADFLGFFSGCLAFMLGLVWLITRLIRDDF